MYYLFEQSASLDTPVECFVFDASAEEFPVRTHWHYFAEFIYMLKGSAEIHTGDADCTLREGEFIILHPCAVHSISSADETPPIYLVLKFEIGKFGLAPRYAPKFRSVFKQAECSGAQIHFSAEESAEMECGRVLSRCAEEMNGSRYGRELIIQSEIYTLLMSIVRRWQDNGLSFDIASAEDDGGGFEGVAEYIDANITDGLRVADVAKRCGMSYSYFAKRFRELYGMSCKEYIERQRIYKAEEFLMFTSHDLSYISQETGFSDCSHLIKSFRRYRGMTPRQFRMKHSSMKY